MENYVYVLIVDDNLEKNFDKIKKTFRPGECVVSTNVCGNRMIITTESSLRTRCGYQSKNLLLDDFKAGKLNKFGKKAEL